jgi:Histidine kinase-, DNA gyrase B-, and HSP90-like ATPase
MFAVEDTGIGMSAEAKKKIFLPFNSSGNQTIKNTQGVGLGTPTFPIMFDFSCKVLMISKQMIELLGEEHSDRLGGKSRVPHIFPHQGQIFPKFMSEFSTELRHDRRRVRLSRHNFQSLHANG